jgi:hypothetical protein
MTYKPYFELQSEVAGGGGYWINHGSYSTLEAAIEFATGMRQARIRARQAQNIPFEKLPDLTFRVLCFGKTFYATVHDIKFQ